MEIKSYTEKSIVLVGNTTEYKTSISELGGKWNSNLKNDKNEKFGGWIFPLSKKHIVENWLKTHSFMSTPSVSNSCSVEQRLEFLEKEYKKIMEILLKITTTSTTSTTTYKNTDFEEDDVKPVKKLLRK